MADEDYASGDFEAPATVDGSGLYLIEGELSDPVDPPEDPIPLANVWAVEFYELDVE
jgi:hypothetical protein